MTDATPPRVASAESLYRGLAALSDDVTRVGVVRRPTRVVDAVVDENHPELGPPASLRDEFVAERDDLKLRGLCEEGAHDAAWENVAFGRRYADYLADDEAAGDALADLRRRRGAGEVLALVDETDARSHVAILRERLG